MIRFKGEEYSKIRKFDCIRIDLEKKSGMGYFTSIPISGKEYRRSNSGNEARVEIEREDFTRFIMIDDWGCRYEIEIDNVHKEEIEQAIKAAEFEELT